MISTSSDTYLPQIKEMWKAVFRDSDDYIRLFFKHQYRCGETLLYLEKGRVGSMLFFPQYGLKIRKKTCKAGYICGAATRPESRGKGFMGKLLNRAFSLMRARGDKFTVLIPATEELGGFFAKYGFRPSFKRGVAEYHAKQCPAGKDNFVSLAQFKDAEKIIRLYDEIIKNRSGVVLQDIRAYNTAIKIHRLQGAAYIIRDKGRREEGYLFCEYDETADVLRVKEILAKKDIINPAAQALFRTYGARKIVFEGMAGGVLPFTKIKETGMIRPLENNAGAVDLGEEYPYMNMMLD